MSSKINSVNQACLTSCFTLNQKNDSKFRVLKLFINKTNLNISTEANQVIFSVRRTPALGNRDALQTGQDETSVTEATCAIIMVFVRIYCIFKSIHQT